jgi:hypothetical protein
MSHPLRRYLLHALAGVLLAPLFGAVALFGLFLLVGNPTPAARVLHAFPIAVRFLIPAGLLSGLALAHRPRSESSAPQLRVVPTLGVLSCAVALLLFGTVRGGQALSFYISVLRPVFTSAATEPLVLSRLGPPDAAITLGVSQHLLADQPCDPRAVRALWYSNPHGHAYRVLYFDHSHHYLCDFSGDIW